jgi:soluble P-type ATPase
MIEIDIPGRGELLLFLVTDYNGTLACDGILLPEVIPLVKLLNPHTSFFASRSICMP